MRPTARDVSQRAEPDVRPLGHVVSAFITNRTRRLTGDVPAQHLMYPVHSTDRQRLGHPASAVLVRSDGRQYTHAVACNALIMTRTSPGKLPQHDNVARITDNKAGGDCTRPNISCSKYYVVMSLGPHVGAQHPCTCPPLAIKGEARNVTQTDSLRLSHSQVHTSSQAQYSTRWSRVLRSGGPNHSKPLCVLVFFPFPPNRQNAYAPPHLRI
jgi:hypothetical protein